MKTKLLVLLSFAICSLGAICSLNADEVLIEDAPRTWTNKQGNEMTGTLLSVEQSQVKLQRADGKLFVLDVKTLSEKDRRYIIRKVRLKRAEQRAEQKRLTEINVSEKSTPLKKADTEATTIGETAAKSTESPKIDTKITEIDAENINGIVWHKNADSAALAMQQNKKDMPILWFRVLGDMKGKM